MFCKYTFLIFKRGDKQENCVRFCKYTFLIFEKGNKLKIVLGFVDIPF